MRTTEAGPLIDEAEVAAFEEKYKISLPSAYRAFLIETNGGRPERDVFPVPGFTQSPAARVHFFLGINDPILSCNLDWNRDVFANRIDEHLLVIASTEVADMICMSLASHTLGSVYYWDGYETSPTYGRLYLVANSFEEFLNLLYRDEDSPKIGVYDVN